MDTSTLTSDHPVDEIDSLCMSCHETGTTRLLLTRIPFFKEIILMSFACPHCNLRNSEIQSAGEIQQRGIKITFTPSTLHDLQRQVVKGDNCIIRIQELDLEIPKGRGQLTNLEGLLQMVKADLEAGQDVRKQADERVYEGVRGVITGIDAILGGDRLPITLTLDDPTGNSSLEPSPDDNTGKFKRTSFARTPTQNAELGLADSSVNGTSADGEQSHIDDGTTAPPSVLRPEYSAATSMYPAAPPSSAHRPNTLEPSTDPSNPTSDEIEENKTYEFPTPCPGCTRPTTTSMRMVRIPHFSEVVIMAMFCASCGYRTNEVKSGGAVPEKGRVIRLKVEESADLSRDILKSESCSLHVPELSLSVEAGTLGGRFTTVEGLLAQVRDDLKASIFDAEGPATSTSEAPTAGETVDAAGRRIMTLTSGDSMPPTERQKWDGFFGKLDAAISGEEEALPFTVEMRDPLAGSYVQSFMAPAPDARIQVEEYERTEEEMEEMGLSAMVTSGYEGEPDQTPVVAEASEVGVEGSRGPGERGSDGKEEIDVDEVQKAVQEKMRELAED